MVCINSKTNTCVKHKKIKDERALLTIVSLDDIISKKKKNYIKITNVLYTGGQKGLSFLNKIERSIIYKLLFRCQSHLHYPYNKYISKMM